MCLGIRYIYTKVLCCENIRRTIHNIIIFFLCQVLVVPDLRRFRHHPLHRQHGSPVHFEGNIHLHRSKSAYNLINIVAQIQAHKINFPKHFKEYHRFLGVL